MLVSDLSSLAVNFLGPKDEYVTSGSDDGHFFIWKKENAELVGVWDGDGSVVNVIEDRPAVHSYPMVAVSGIDNTVKVCGSLVLWLALLNSSLCESSSLRLPGPNESTTTRADQRVSSMLIKAERMEYT